MDKRRVYGLGVGLLWSLGLIWFFGSATPAWATIAAAPPAPTLSSPSLDISSSDIPLEKIDQFVSAYLQVVQLVEDRSEALQRAETEAESTRLQRAAQAEAFDLIKAVGLSQQDYWQLLGLANSDSEFRDRVLSQLEEQDRSFSP